MDRLYVGYNPNDAEVDSLLSQLNDESLLKLKVNSHSHKTSTSSCGFEYPTFTDGWANDDDDDDGRRSGRGDLDHQLASRFSSLKLPISSARKKGRDPSAGLGTAMGRKKGGFNSDKLARKGSGGGRDYHYPQADSGGRTAADYWEALGKQGRDSGGLGRRRSSRDYEVMGKKGRDLQAGVWRGRNLEAVGEEGEEEEQEQEQLQERERERDDGARNAIKGSTRSENGSNGKQPQQQQQSKGESSRALSQKTELLSCKSSDDLAAAAAAASDEDGNELDNIDAQLHERFRALKAPPPPPSPARAPLSSSARNKNAGLDNLLQFSEQQHQQQQQSMISSSNGNEYDSFGSSFSTPTSPSAKLLGRSKSRSSPRVMTSSVSSSCHCSAPSPLKLLKQVSSKSFPAKQQYPQQQQLPHSSSGGPIPLPLPPASSTSSAPPQRSPPLKSKTMNGSGRDFKVEGFGNSKPSSAVKETEKPANEKEKKAKKESKKDTTAKKQMSNNGSGGVGVGIGVGIGNSVENNGSSGPSSTVKDMKRLLSSVADRVGLERSRVSSAEDDFLGEEDLRSWAVLDDGQPDDDDDEFARVSTEEENLNREAERVLEWAKDAARLGPRVGEESDEDSDDDAFRLGSDDDGDSDSGDSCPSDGVPPKEKKVQKEAKVPPKKKKWGLFN